MSFLEAVRRDGHARILDVCDNIYRIEADKRSTVSHLHQSDLLVLDFHLGDTGDIAIAALKEVFTNSQFNLVILHSAAEPLTNFRQVIPTFLKPTDKFSHPETLARADALLEQAEREAEGFFDRIKETVDIDRYLHVRQVAVGALSAKSFLSPQNRRHRSGAA